MRRGTEPLVWFYGAYRNMKHVAPQTAIRRDNHKLIWELDSGRTYLYDLDLDLSETTDCRASGQRSRNRCTRN